MRHIPKDVSHVLRLSVPSTQAKQWFGGTGEGGRLYPTLRTNSCSDRQTNWRGHQDTAVVGRSLSQGREQIGHSMFVLSQPKVEQ